MMTRLYQTARGAERILLCPLSANPFRYFSLYSLLVPGLRTGDIVQVSGQLEVTNELAKKYSDPLINVMLAHFLVRSEAMPPVEIPRDPLPGPLIAPAFGAGENVSPDEHHGYRSLGGAFEADQDGDVWVTLAIYAGAGNRTRPGDTLDVMQRYGGLSALVLPVAAS
ncbi:MAG TPA: hypothetical protein VJ820_01205 [Propionibacteriaceae bacterium]|nr:hypothetical protein [Propionibacteriaceae bacterium]